MFQSLDRQRDTNFWTWHNADNKIVGRLFNDPQIFPLFRWRRIPALGSESYNTTEEMYEK